MTGNMNSLRMYVPEFADVYIDDTVTSKASVSLQVYIADSRFKWRHRHKA